MFPQVPHQGGPVLGSPAIVPVFFASDPLRTELGQFYEWLANSSYLNESLKEYGIAAAVPQPDVELSTAPPDEIDDADIAKFIATAVANKTLPAPTADTVYAMHYPASTKVTYSGAAGCEGFGGYHSRTSVTGGAMSGMVAYAVMPRCTWDEQDFLLTTNFATHELLESITDPMGPLDPAWRLDDSPGSPTEAWANIGGTQLSDLCENQMYDTVGGFWVQDIWSNQAAAAGLNPCQPSDPSRPLFTVVTEATIVHAEPGQTLTIQALATSNLPTPAWQLAINLYPPPSDFDGGATLDRTWVNNGDKIAVTLTVPANPPMKSGRSVYRFTIDSMEADGSGFYHPWPVIVVVP